MVSYSQPFFVLHEALSRKSEKKSTGTRKTRRRIDLSPLLPKNGESLEADRGEECDDYRHMNMRMEAFEAVWSKIDTTIKVCPSDTFLSLGFIYLFILNFRLYLVAEV